MKAAVVVDIDETRDKQHQVIIQQVTITQNDKIIPTENINIIEQMAILCEGICMLIHCADQEKIKPSYKSIEDCIKHLTSGFVDASYKASIKNKKYIMNKSEQSIIQGQNGLGLKRFLKQLFCNHKYEIGIIIGLGFTNNSTKCNAKDGAEITCFCSKCNKKFIVVSVTSNGVITK
jgi:hypothetical protein